MKKFFLPFGARKGKQTEIQTVLFVVLFISKESSVITIHEG